MKWCANSIYYITNVMMICIPKIRRSGNSWFYVRRIALSQASASLFQPRIRGIFSPVRKSATWYISAQWRLLSSQLVNYPIKVGNPQRLHSCVVNIFQDQPGYITGPQGGPLNKRGPFALVPMFALSSHSYWQDTVSARTTQERETKWRLSAHNFEGGEQSIDR